MDNGVGGQLHGISLDSFLQMVQMEKSNCTLKVTTEEDMGWLFVLKGNLIAAETGAISGFQAACTIISWENSTIEIDNVCEKKNDEIKQPLMNVLMEGLRLRDESREKGGAKPKPSSGGTKPSPPAEAVPQKKKAGKKASKPAPASAGEKPAQKPAQPVPVDMAPAKKRAMGKIPLAAGILVLVVAGGYLAFSFFGGSANKSYQQVLAQMQTVENTEKIRLLQAFISSNEPGEQTQDAAARIKKLKTLMEKADFNALSRLVKELSSKGDYQKGISALRQYLNKYPHSFFRKKIDKQLANLDELMEARDFNRLTSRANELGADRMDLYLAYLKDHPKGKHRKEVEKQIEEMETEYFIHIEAQILGEDTKEDWESCIALAKKYTNVYPLSRRAEQLNKLKEIWREKISEKQVFQTLKRSAESKGTDYAAAALIYTNYLSTNPNSYMKEKIKHELGLLDQHLNDQRLAKETQRITALLARSTARFTENGNGTVTDAKTGLMWCTLDSLTVANACLGYDEAVAYVESLRTGGHTDWRLPVPDELVTLYKKEPFFPEAEPTWYWSSKTNRRYMGEWVTDVEVVTSANSTQWSPEVRDARACGSVRAVRKAK